MRISSHLAFISILISCLVVQTSVFSQSKPAVVPERIAFIDHSKLRKDFPKYADQRNVQIKKLSDLKVNHEKKLKTEEENLRELIIEDSVAGGKKKKDLEDNSSRKIQELETKLALDKKMVHEENIQVMQTFEKRIVSAIEEALREKGYTDVKPVGKETPKDNKDDITDLVLKKLN